MTISFEIPHEIETQIRTEGADLEREARELYLLELYRQDRISHAQLRDALGASFQETEKLIKAHAAGHDYSVEEFEEQRHALRGTRPQ
jgi:predicted HTH domain antitoxin